MRCGLQKIMARSGQLLDQEKFINTAADGVESSIPTNERAAGAIFRFLATNQGAIDRFAYIFGIGIYCPLRASSMRGLTAGSDAL